MVDHPYKDLESSATWAVISAALSDLEENQDIQLATRREYVVGYLTKKCLESRKQEDGSADSN